LTPKISDGGQWEDLKTSNIFNYATKQGYNIGLLEKGLEKSFDAFLTKRGFNPN
jgi:hypothetical protein